MRRVKAFPAAAVLAVLLGAPAVMAQAPSAPGASGRVSGSPFYQGNQCVRTADTGFIECFRWQAGPQPRDLESVYPARALSVAMPGVATLRCVVGADSRLTGCAVAGESPAGVGFGAAALKLAQLFEVSATTTGRSVVGQTVVTPVWFDAIPQGEDPNLLNINTSLDRARARRTMAAGLGCADQQPPTAVSGSALVCGGL